MQYSRKYQTIFLSQVLVMIFIQFLSLNGQEIVLTINNEAVTDEEFIFFMKQERALTYSYFYTNYGAEQSPEFWNTSFVGETPVQYIQNLTIKKLVEINKHLVLAREFGQLDDISFKAIQNKYELENKRRSEAIEKGEVIYGPKEFSMFTFFSYWYSNLVIDIRKAWGNRYQPDKNSLHSYYMRHQNNYKSPDELLLTEVSVAYGDNLDKNKAIQLAGEILSSKSFDPNICEYTGVECKEFTMPDKGTMESEDYLGERYELARQLQVGELGGPIEDNKKRRIVLILCKQRKVGDSQAFEEVSHIVKKDFIDEEFQIYLIERTARAEIEIVCNDFDDILLNHLK